MKKSGSRKVGATHAARRSARREEWNERIGGEARVGVVRKPRLVEVGRGHRGGHKRHDHEQERTENDWCGGGQHHERGGGVFGRDVDERYGDRPRCIHMQQPNEYPDNERPASPDERDAHPTENDQQAGQCPADCPSEHEHRIRQAAVHGVGVENRGVKDDEDRDRQDRGVPAPSPQQRTGARRAAGGNEEMTW